MGYGVSFPAAWRTGGMDEDGVSVSAHDGACVGVDDVVVPMAGEVCWRMNATAPLLLAFGSCCAVTPRPRSLTASMYLRSLLNTLVCMSALLASSVSISISTEMPCWRRMYSAVLGAG